MIGFNFNDILHYGLQVLVNITKVTRCPVQGVLFLELYHKPLYENPSCGHSPSTFVRTRLPFQPSATVR